ncbi:MAG: hypothetical protein EXS35_05370 [Pedosphaera sp.]|nr:hypothetical protein [Pedosphaera sp.]
MKPIQRNVVSLLLVAVSFVAAGCGTPAPKPVAWTIVVNKTTPASIEVDLIGVTALDKTYWMNTVKPNDYWKPGNPTRKNAKKIATKFETGPVWTVRGDDPVWRTWFSYGASELLVFADLKARDMSNDATDARRLILPLDKNAWEAKDKVLNIVIEDERVYTTTAPKLPK